MYQKYGSDPIRNIMVDKVVSTAEAYDLAMRNLKNYDKKKREKTYGKEDQQPRQTIRGATIV